MSALSVLTQFQNAIIWYLMIFYDAKSNTNTNIFLFIWLVIVLTKTYFMESTQYGPPCC